MTDSPLVVWLPMGDLRTPSSRLRSLAVSSWLEKQRSVRNLFPPFELTEVPAALFVEKKCDPETISIARQLKAHGTRVIYDLCDPVWLQPDINRQRKWNVKGMLSVADRITVPTPVMAQDLVAAFDEVDPSVITVIPDRLDLSAGLPEPSRMEEQEVLRVGWIGSSLNMEHIPMVAGVLTSLCEESSLSLRLITQSHQGLVTAVPHVPVEYVPWTLEGHLDALRVCDCAIIPMADRPSTRTKSSNRLRLCLSLGLPVVASPLPSYVELMRGTHFVSFANSADEWTAGLRSMTDVNHRMQVARQARTFAADHCAFEAVAPRWEEVLLA